MDVSEELKELDQTLSSIEAVVDLDALRRELADLNEKAAAPEEMVCRRILLTGSNVASERVCMAKSEWKRASDRDKEFLERVQNGRRSGN